MTEPSLTPAQIAGQLAASKRCIAPHGDCPVCVQHLVTAAAFAKALFPDSQERRTEFLLRAT